MFEKHSFGAEPLVNDSHPEGGVAASRYKIARHRFAEKRNQRLAMEATTPPKLAAIRGLMEMFGSFAAMLLRRA